MNLPEIQVMKLKFHSIDVQCCKCVRIISEPEILFKSGSGKYTIKCSQCDRDLVYIVIEDGYIVEIRDDKNYDSTDYFKDLIEVIW